jgi:hypothetical protein
MAAGGNRETGSNITMVPIIMKFCIKTPAATINSISTLSSTSIKVITHLIPINSQR